MLLFSDQRFPKEYRLLNRQDYLDVQQNGTRVTSRLFVGLFQRESSDTHARIGITATRRFGNAVTRNRTRRIVREAFRTERLSVPVGLALVVIPKRDVPGTTTTEIMADLQLLGERIHRMLESQP